MTRPGTQGPQAYPSSWKPAGAPPFDEPPNFEALQLCIDAFVAALSDEEFNSLVLLGTWPPASSVAAISAEQSCSDAVGGISVVTRLRLPGLRLLLPVLSRLLLLPVTADPKILTDIVGGAHLFNTRPAPVDPAHTIVAAAVDGSLTAERLDELLVAGANQQQVANYTGDVRQRSERMFTEAFRKALREGACDALLNSMRPVWDEHAAAVAEARSEISPESSVEHILATGSAKLVECWQQLPEHLAALNKIVSVARQFGPRLGNFPMIREYANSDNYLLEDSAIWCCAGNSLAADSAAFRRPSPQPRQHPLFAVVLRLNTVAEARERYRQWASSQWEQQNSGLRGGHIDIDTGRMVEDPRPTNPFAADADATVG